MRNLSINWKLSALVLMPILCMVGLTLMTTATMRQELETLRSAKARTALEATYSMLERYEERARFGLMTEEAARSAALGVIRGLRYDNGEGYVAVVSDGFVNLMHPIDPKLDGAYMGDFQTSDGRYVAREAVAAGRLGGIRRLVYPFEHPVTGELDTKRSAIARFEPWGWTLVVGVFDTSFEAVLASILTEMLTAAAIAAAGCLILATLISRSLGVPLSELTARIRDLAAGRLDGPVPHVAARNEFGEIARALETFKGTALELAATKADLEEALVSEQKSAEALSVLAEQREAALKTSEMGFHLALEAVADGVWDWRISEGRIVFTRSNWELLDLTRDDWPDDFSSWARRVHPDDLNYVQAEAKRHLESRAPYDVTYRIRAADGEWRRWRSRGQARWDEAGAPQRFIGTNSDVTDLHLARELAEEQARTLLAQNEALRVMRDKEAWNAEHDALTGLPNRRHVERRWDEFVAAAVERGLAPAVLHLDLDHFKRVNDRLGHAAGDQLLTELVARLSEIIGPGELIARVGGDEFLVLAFTDPSGAMAKELGERLMAAIRKPFRLSQQEFRLGASVGVAFARAEDADRDRLVSEADAAMYTAKSAGRLRVNVFDSAAAEQEREKRRLADDLFRAIEGEEIIAFYQPQVRTEDFVVVGVEALARWRHPELGLLSPAKFVPLAEDLGLIDRVDQRVLDCALEELKVVEAATGASLRLGVNFSLRRLSDLTLADRFRNLEFPKAGFSAEIVETVLLDQADEAVLWNLNQLREIGAQIELDDFGSGHTSVLSLVNLRPDRVKIDRQIIGTAFGDGARLSIVRAILEMCDELGLATLAEGVETEEQAAALARMGVHELQGYYFGAPTPLAGLIAAISGPASAENAV